jgi:hypothetical protein
MKLTELNHKHATIENSKGHRFHLTFMSNNKLKVYCYETEKTTFINTSKEVL